MKNLLYVRPVFVLFVVCLHAGDALEGFFSQTLPIAQCLLQPQPIRVGHHFWTANHYAKLGNPGLHQPEQWRDLSMDPWNSMAGISFNTLAHILKIISQETNKTQYCIWRFCDYSLCVCVCVSGQPPWHSPRSSFCSCQQFCLQISIWTTVKLKT